MPDFEEEKEKLLSFYRAPNETEFFIYLGYLIQRYNGTLPGHNIPNSVVSCGSLWAGIIGMLAMGMATDPYKILKYAKKPIGPLIGMICQFAIMPSIAIVYLAAIDIGTYEALVIMLYSCSPGGGLSNLITYYMGGDLDLSVTMTMLSCTLALVLTPAWIHVVTRVVHSADELKTPYDEIWKTIAALVIPALVGSFFNWLGQKRKFSEKLRILTNVLAGSALVGLIASLILGIFKFYLTAIITQAQLIYTALVPFVGFAIAVVLSFVVVSILEIFGSTPNMRSLQHLTIGVETAVQSARIVNVITLALYKDKMFENAQTFFFPLLGFGWQIVFGGLLVLIMRIPYIRRMITRENIEKTSDYGLQNITFSESKQSIRE